MKNKVIFESEEEAKEFLDITYCASNMLTAGKERMFENIKNVGYIRKSVVEEAEEMYLAYIENFKNNVDIDSDDKDETIEDLWKAIQHLKAENERLKCLKL